MCMKHVSTGGCETHGGREMRKGDFGVNAKSTDPDQPAVIFSKSRNFAILYHIL